MTMNQYISEAQNEWDQARRKAFWAQMLAGLSRKNVHLLDFSTIAQRLHLRHAIYRGVCDIPLSQIVGSEDRYGDFTQAFLPLKKDLRHRWKSVAMLYLDPASRGAPPIEVYKVGDVYFVRDGHHRLSVVRQLEMSHIEAYVWEFQAPIPGADAEIDLETLLLEAGRREFLDQTRLDEIRPGHHIRLTRPGGYIDLLRQIAHYQDVLNQIDRVETPYEEAVTAWYDMIYETTAQLIEEEGVLDRFPDRTVTDLFVWTMRRRDELEQRYRRRPMVRDTIRQIRQRAGESWPVRLGRGLVEKVLRRPV